MRLPLRGGSLRTLVIVQPYLPAYNVPFFMRLNQRLRDLSVNLSVIHGQPETGMAARRDSGQFSYAVEVKTQEFGSLPLDWKRVASEIRRQRPDLVILEHARSHLETYGMLARSLGGGPRVAWWGHGKSYGREESGLAAAWRQSLLYYGDWFFSYTAGGADYVVQRGFPRTRVTVVNNTVDTDELGRDLKAVTKADEADFLMKHQAVRGHTGLFIGGVDAKKGIPFLLSAAAEIRRTDPDFTLLVAGSGDLVESLQGGSARANGIRPLGRVTGQAKAVALSAADVLLVPREVGLVAVDSLVGGTPIVTVSGRGHGPEFEYLTPEQDVIVVPEESVEAYAGAVTSLLRDQELLARMSGAGRHRARTLTMDNMVDAFARGVADWTDVADAHLGRARKVRA